MILKSYANGPLWEMTWSTYFYAINIDPQPDWGMQLLLEAQPLSVPLVNISWTFQALKRHDHLSDFYAP